MDTMPLFLYGEVSGNITDGNMAVNLPETNLSIDFA